MQKAFDTTKQDFLYNYLLKQTPNKNVKSVQNSIKVKFLNTYVFCCRNTGAESFYPDNFST